LSPWQYEAYQPMAEREMEGICAKIRERWAVRHIAMAHRTGVVPIGEASVEIAVSSAHRREALEAVQFAIDELKTRVPIWKKEVYEGETAAWKQNKEAAGWHQPEAPDAKAA
jgi:molybdopterin synthase catalytic subunit